MKRVPQKKVTRKVTKFLANKSKEESISSLSPTCSSSPNLCLTNAGLVNGFTREELLELFVSFGEVQDLIMLEGKSFSVLSFREIESAVESEKVLNGSYCLKEQTKPLYMCFLEVIDEKLSSLQEIPRILPSGLKLEENFISEEEENGFLEFPQFKSHISHLKNRAVKHYGFAFNYETNKVDKKELLEEIPVEVEPLLVKIKETFKIDKPNQLTVTFYEPGQGIPFHVDTHSSFEDGIVSLSLGSDIVMDFRHPDGRQVSVVLPRRSCMVMTGESRFLWSHGITPRKHDVIDAPGKGLTTIRREHRTSLTFRRVRDSKICSCPFPGCCDTQLFDNSNFSEETADSIERNHVFNVYNEIAAHFSDTRHQPWPNVSKFIQSLPVGSLLIDVGCGNGKYLNTSHTYNIGCDRSSKLLEICHKRNHQVMNSDCRFSPMRDGVADAVICIAVIHHLATEERRLQAVKDISRILCVGGHALIYVWAMEQQIGSQKSTYLMQKKNETTKVEEIPSTMLPVHENRTNFKHANVFVPWKTKSNTQNSDTFLRFYHVFKEGELEALCSQISDITICRKFYDQGNWCVEFKKEK